MSGNRDGLLDAWDVLRADLTTATDLLYRWADDKISADDLRHLHADTRTFLLNIVVGGR